VTTTTTEHPVSLTRVFAWSVLAMLVFSFVVGAAVLPLRPTDGQFSSWWDGICRAVGVPLDVRTQAQPTSSPVVNAFVWSAEMERRVRRANLQNGGASSSLVRRATIPRTAPPIRTSQILRG